MGQRRFSTSTLAGEEIVPWLASAGKLAYSPDSPPERDYYSQYFWVKPPPPIMSLLYSRHALEEWCAGRKFGSNYVKFQTPLANIRITTFVCDETEIKVIDPNKLEVIEAVGCRVREVCI